jgi:hypothetical protein
MSDPSLPIIAFNASVSNTTNVARVLEFTEFRKSNIVDRCEDYLVRVYESKIPVMSVPLFKMDPDSMYVTIGDSTVALQPLQLNPINGGTVFIFYIQQFLDSLNNALAEAHDNELITGAQPSFMFYDYEQDLLKFIIDERYLGGALSAPIPIYFNIKLLYKLTGFMNYFDGSLGDFKSYRIMYEIFAPAYIQDFNGTDSVVMPSQSKFYKDFLEFQSIVITFRSLKLNQQYISTAEGQNSSLPILAEIPISFEEINSSKHLTFSQVYPKWTAINGQGPLNNLDMFVYYVGDDFQIYPVFLLPGQKFNFRLEFMRKDAIL